MPPRKRTCIIIVLLVIFVALLGAGYFFIHKKTLVPLPADNLAGLPLFTRENLIKYNGTDATLPIYVALDGYVYDVTPGKEFYIPGGTYHRIAGTDASSELHLFGGDIIREKYKIVGTFTL